MLRLISSLPVLDRVFDDVMRDSALAYTSVASAPSVDVTTHDDKTVFSLDVPGVKPDDLSVEVRGNVLAVRGERPVSGGRRAGTFAWSWALPEGMDTDTLEASLDSGVLTIAIAKHPKAKPRRIPIVTGARSGDKQLEDGNEKR